MFRDKLREKRKKARQLSRERKRSLNVDVNDPESMQRFFIQELHLGEELLSKGDVEGCVEHFGNAVAVCGRPQQILEALQRSLPLPVFHLLLQQLPSADERLVAKTSGSAAKTRQAVEELPD